MVLLTKFYVETLKKNPVTLQKEWVGEMIYYYGDLRNADFENDWRFKACPTRKQALFIDVLNKEPEHWEDKLYK